MSSFLQYREEDMNNALENVKLHKMSYRYAAKKFGVPRSTLRNKVLGFSPPERRMGPSPILMKAEEAEICEWVEKLAQAGFRVTMLQLQESVKNLFKEMKRPNPFTGEKPGRSWIKGFIKRNPTMSKRISQTLTVSSPAVTEDQILKWFKEVQLYLKKNNQDHIMKDPSRIFNSDETAFFLNPKGQKVLAKRGDKSVYQKGNTDEKECITVLVTGNADGSVAPSAVVYRYQVLQETISETFPRDWAIGKTDSGWMTCGAFYEYIANTFHPWLLQKKITLPIILFVDAHVSYLSFHISKFCESHGIILVALHPKDTQPLDVAVFPSLNDGWKRKVHQWRIERVSKDEPPILKIVNFAPLLKEVIDQCASESVLKNGFGKCGLYPWDRELDSVPGQRSENEPTSNDSCVKYLMNGLEFLNENIDPEKLQVFQSNFDTHETWLGDPTDTSLFVLWKRTKEELLNRLWSKLTSSNDTCAHTEQRSEIINSESENETLFPDPLHVSEEIASPIVDPIEPIPRESATQTTSEGMIQQAATDPLHQSKKLKTKQKKRKRTLSSDSSDSTNSTDYQPSTHRNDRTSGKEKSSTRRFEKVKKERLSSSSVSSSTDDMDDMEENTAENDISEEDATDTIKSEDVNPDSASQDDSNSLHESSLTKPADKFIKIEPADLSSYDINTASTSNFIYHNIKEEAIIEDEDFEKPSTSHLNCDITSNSESADTNIYIKIEPHDSPSHEDNTVSSTNIKDEPFEEDKFEAVILNTLLGAPKAFLVSECSHESLNVNESTERAESSLRNFLDANLNTKFCEDIYQETNKSQQSSDLDISFTKLLPVSNNNFNNLFENDASILDPNYLEECQVSPERYVKTSDFDAAVAEDRAQENKVDKIIIEAETELNDGDGENEVGVTEIGILDNTQEHPKKGRKIPSQNRHSIKQKCQKGKIKLSKEFRQYLCNCACLDKLGLEKAKEEYYKFYAAESHSAQRALICSMVRECPVKRKRVKESNKRNYTREYVVNGVTVCKKFFLETFRISSGKVDVAVKCKKRPEGVKDLRGVGGGKN